MANFMNIFNFDLDKREHELREEGLTEERIAEIFARIKENGAPKHWKYSKRGDYLYFDTPTDHLTWDLSRGAWPLLYTSGTHRWTCELQQVSGVWIPNKITIEIGHSEGSYSTEDITWTHQKINEPIDEKLWTVPSLGVRRGDQGFDARTETTFIVEGDEYLPSLEQEEIEAFFKKHEYRWTFVHYVMIFIGVLMIIAACYMKYRRWKID